MSIGKHIKGQEKLLNIAENSSKPCMMEHKSTQSDSDTENEEIKLANEKLLVEKEKLETELVIRVSEISRLSNEKNKQKNENIQLKQKTNALEGEEEKFQRKLKTQGNMLVHLKG